MTIQDNGAAAGRITAASLNDTIHLFDEYYRWCDRTYHGKFNALGIEVRKRLVQITFLVDRIIELCESSARLFQSDPALEKRLREIDRELELWTEATYWFASRARGVIRLLPKLTTFESAGVRNVRNKLLEHPEGSDSQVLITSFGYGGDNGPVVKALRPVHQQDVWVDEGLFVNLAEFADQLEKSINRAVS